MEKIKEGKATIYTSTGKVSKKMGVFYNPVMKLNRDISVILLKALNKKQMQLSDPFAGTGVRSIRFLKELKSIRKVYLNDNSKDAIKLIKKNLKLNKVKAEIHNEDANLFLLNSKGFDYIDIDPFGFPGRFLFAAVERISRNGVLAVTATDTSALSGTMFAACKRKYWARPLKNELMHEVGLRILIRKVQLVAAQSEKALTPIFSYSKDHYMRVFFFCEKGRKKADKVLNQHGVLVYNNDCAGPLWLGPLWDKKLVNKMAKQKMDDETSKFISVIKKESAINTVGFFDIHKICKKNKLNIPKRDVLIKKIKKAGFKVTETHFSPNSLRSNITMEKLIKLIK